MSIEVIARGGGVFVVDPKGPNPSKHTAERKAIQEASRRIGTGLVNEVEIVQNLVVLVRRVDDEPAVEEPIRLLDASLDAVAGQHGVLTVNLSRPAHVRAYDGPDLIAEGESPTITTIRILEISRMSLHLYADDAAESYDLGTHEFDVVAP